jgi:hypothetical protein
MSTVGTLYDDTITNGFAKLLSAQVVTNVSVVDFVAPLAFGLGYRTFWFDFDNLICNTDSQRLVAYVSTNGGASFQGDYLWSILRTYSHLAMDTYGSVALTPDSGGGVYRGTMWIGDGQAGNLYTSGRLYFNRCAAGLGGTRMLYGEVVNRHPSYGVSVMQNAQTPWAGGDWNAIRFQYTAGTMSGAIRLYGLKTGSN